MLLVLLFLSAGQVGLGLPFARWLLPRIRQHFPDFPDRPAEDLYAAENVIKSPSLIRVEADEVRQCSCMDVHT
jgi:Zn-dependent M32 family carboxypeptidase